VDGVTSAELFGKRRAEIERSDFCVFDNIGTRDRPNVYIEFGIAYALERPSILCSLEGDRGGRPETSVLASDLRGMIRVPYPSYADLFRTPLFQSPLFLDENRLLDRLA